MGDIKSNNVEFIEELSHTKTLEQVTTMGTVKLTDGATVYIPTPTADPQDPRTCFQLQRTYDRNLLFAMASRSCDTTILTGMRSQLPRLAKMGDSGHHLLL